MKRVVPLSFLKKFLTRWEGRWHNSYVDAWKDVRWHELAGCGSWKSTTGVVQLQAVHSNRSNSDQRHTGSGRRGQQCRRPHRGRNPLPFDGYQKRTDRDEVEGGGIFNWILQISSFAFCDNQHVMFRVLTDKQTADFAFGLINHQTEDFFGFRSQYRNGI